MYTVTEKDMIITMAAVLESENQITLANVIGISKFIYDPQWDFSNILPNQKKLYATIKAPLDFKQLVENNLEILSKISSSIYDDDDRFYYLGINKVGVLPIRTEELELNEKRIILQKDSVYSNFIKFLASNSKIDDLQKKYLFEACEAGNSNNMLSATVMLGCAAELLLKKLCESYSLYLKNHGTPTEQSIFEAKVIKAKVAYTRLDEFLKRVETNEVVFKRYGFENVRLNFNFLDIIRQTRNDSGHPTGNYITQEQFRMMLSNYQSFLDKAISAIQGLPII